MPIVKVPLDEAKRIRQEYLDTDFEWGDKTRFYARHANRLGVSVETIRKVAIGYTRDEYSDHEVNTEPGGGADRKLDDIMSFIATYKAEHDGVPPQVAEIAESLGYSGNVPIIHGLSRLEQQGRVVRGGGHSRNLRIPGESWAYEGDDPAVLEALGGEASG